MDAFILFGLSKCSTNHFMGGAHHKYIMPMLYVLEQVMISTTYVLANVPQTFWVHMLHPIRGLIRCKILHFACDMAHFICLMVVVQDVFNYGFAWLPKIHQSHEDVYSSWHDLLGLLSFDHEQQHMVIEKKLKFHLQDYP